MKPSTPSSPQAEPLETARSPQIEDAIDALQAEAGADPIDPAPWLSAPPSPASGGLWWMLPILVMAWSLNFIFIKIGIQALSPLSPNAPLAVANARTLVAMVALALLLPFFGGREVPRAGRGPAAGHRSPARSDQPAGVPTNFVRGVEERPASPGGRTAFGGRLHRLTWGDVGFLLFLGANGVALNQFFFVNGLARTSVAHGSLLLALSPVTVFLLAMLSRQERISGIKFAGMGLAILGTTMLIGSAHGGEATGRGDMLMILKILVFAIYTVTSKHVRERFETLIFNFYVYFFGSALLAPLSWHTLRHTHWLAIPWRGWMAILYIALIGSVLAYMVFYRALKIMSASQLASLTYLEPVVAMAAGVLILHEHVTPQILGGGMVIFGGVYLTQLKKRPAWLRAA